MSPKEASNGAIHQMIKNLTIPITLTHEAACPLKAWSITRGVPLPKGMYTDTEGLCVLNPAGDLVPAQYRVLSHWPDGSVRWVLTDFQADGPADQPLIYSLIHRPDEIAPAHPLPVRIEETDEHIIVDTGRLRFYISLNNYSLFDSVSLRNASNGGKAYTVYEKQNGGGDAWGKISEGGSEGGTVRRIYGMGGICRASLAPDAYSATIEEAGPLRTVIRLDGALEADIPMHHYAGYRPLRCTTRIHAYAGHAFVRVLHTLIMTCNPRETEIDELAMHIPITLNGPERRYAYASDHQEKRGALNSGETLDIAQRLDNHVQVHRHQGAASRVVSEGKRTDGWLTLDDGITGLGVAFRHMAEEYPKALETTVGAEGITAYFWRDPDGKRLSLSRYAEEVAWHEGEGVYADGTGLAKTSECFVCYYEASQQEEAIETLRTTLKPPHAAVDLAWMARCETTGGFASYDPHAFPASERMMTGCADWMERNVHLGRWYSFLDWGDILAAWDEANDDWRFRGRWGWCNSEWDPRHGLWIQYLRTGDPRYFELGEAMTRHSTDVDTCHWHPFRPYMVGGCYRHSTDHFSDEPCASHTFIDNWMDYYYLTGDWRTYDVIKEAGAFFMRYRWTENPAYSFSLRSIANTLRGLLYLFEVTGDTCFKQRAEEVYEVIARGQNDDGSWHKRFQVSTPDKLPTQLPYGMATEGTTLAVEMGTAEPFTDEEYLALGGSFIRLIRELPYEEQKGYQTHYLMIGLELMHRLTGRSDVAEVYRRAVDWFCGYPDTFASERPLEEHYGGMLCRHTAYAYRLTGDTRYMDTGRNILHRLIDMQDWSDDPKRHGNIGMSPTYLSLLFFGVPYLLSAMQDAGLEE